MRVLSLDEECGLAVGGVHPALWCLGGAAGALLAHSREAGASAGSSAVAAGGGCVAAMVASLPMGATAALAIVVISDSIARDMANKNNPSNPGAPGGSGGGSGGSGSSSDGVNFSFGAPGPFIVQPETTSVFDGY